jgi:hypothetical protein
MLDKVARSDIAELLVALSELRRDVANLHKLIEQRLGPGDDDDITVTAAAALAGRSAQTVRNWASEVGYFDSKLRRFVISKRKLANYMRARFGTVPRALAEF